MGALQVYNFLMKHAPRPFGPTEIGDKLGLSKPTVQVQLKSLWLSGKIHKTSERKYYVVKESSAPIQHTSSIISGLLSIIQKEHIKNLDGIQSDPEYKTYAYEHLYTGYLEIYQSSDTLKTNMKKLKKCEILIDNAEFMLKHFPDKINTDISKKKEKYGELNELKAEIIKNKIDFENKIDILIKKLNDNTENLMGSCKICK